MKRASTGQAPPLGHVVGENVRRLRDSFRLTQAEVARLTRRNGLRWSRSHVAALESGQRESIDLGVLVLLADALSVPPRQLLEGDGLVLLGEDTTTTRESLRALLTGKAQIDLTVTDTATAGLAGNPTQTLTLGRTPAGPTGLHRWYDVSPIEADNELAARLGVSSEVVIEAARTLWGTTLHAERDRRAAETSDTLEASTRRTRRGHITRELAKEIENVLRGEHA